MICRAIHDLSLMPLTSAVCCQSHMSSNALICIMLQQQLWISICRCASILASTFTKVFINVPLCAAYLAIVWLRRGKFRSRIPLSFTALKGHMGEEYVQRNPGVLRIIRVAESSASNLDNLASTKKEHGRPSSSEQVTLLLEHYLWRFRTCAVGTAHFSIANFLRTTRQNLARETGPTIIPTGNDGICA